MTALEVSVSEYRRVLTPREIGLTRDAQTVSTLRSEYVPLWFANRTAWRWRADFDAPPGFQRYVDMYSEFTTHQPWDDVALFFDRVEKAGSGGAPLDSLSYSDARPLMNYAAMASAAEALAGWFCETHYGWEIVKRPQMVSPDILFFDEANGLLAMVEVKSSSVQGNLRSRLTSAMIDLLKILAPTKQLRPGRYCVNIIMIQVIGVAEVNLTSLVLEEP